MIAGDENNLHLSNIPAANEVLHKDETGEEHKHVFNYHHVIGMFTYL